MGQQKTTTLRFSVVSGKPYTLDGRWVVADNTTQTIAYDPGNDYSELDPKDCIEWIHQKLECMQ